MDKFLHYKSGPSDISGTKPLFMDKESSDVKIVVYDEVPDNDASEVSTSKSLDCHKTVLSSKSEVFKAMFANNSMVESSSGEVKITDVPANVMELLLRYIYYDDVAIKDITCELLMAAEKYNVEKLVNICVKHLAENLTKENVMNGRTYQWYKLLRFYIHRDSLLIRVVEYSLCSLYNKMLLSICQFIVKTLG